jgi:type II secretory pathway component GspD/PulD (secretin)
MRHVPFVLVAGVVVVAAVVGGLAAWPVEAGDDVSPVAERLSAIEARLAALEKRLAALESPAPRAAAAAPAGPRPRSADEVRAIRTSVAFQDVSVTSVLRGLSATHGLNMVTSPEATLLGNATRVTLQVQDAKLGDLLDSIAAKAELAWTVEDYGIVRIRAAAER